MLVDTFAYIASLVKIYLSVTALVILLPLVMWRDHLRGKSAIYRFLFCVVTQNVYTANLVLLLGFFKIANSLTVWAGLLIEYVLVRWFTNWRYRDETVGRMLKRTFATLFSRKELSKLLKHKLLDMRMGLRRKLAKDRQKHHSTASGLLIPVILAVAVIYNIIFINHNILGPGHSYQFSDIPVHLSWVYNLEQGTLFSAGIYPFYMHSMIYAIRALTGINLREILLYFGSYQTILTMLCMYCFARRIFQNKYVALLPVGFFSLLLNNGRYAASLPQESGMFALLTLGYFLVEFLSSEREEHILPTDSGARRFRRLNHYFFRRYMTTDLLMVMLSVGLVIGYHFYTAIAAIFLVLSFAIAYLPRLWRKKYWLPLFTAGMLGVLIAVLPFIACLAKGIPFQESMAWATSVIKGETWVNEEQDNYQNGLNGETSEDKTESEATESPAEGEEAEDDRPLTEKAVSFVRRLITAEKNFGGGSLYGHDSVLLMFLCIALAIVACILLSFSKGTRSTGFNYITLAYYCFFISLLGTSYEMGMIRLVDSGRAGVFIQPVLFILYALPVDILCRMVGGLFKNHLRPLQSGIALLLCGVMLFGVYQVGWMHKYFDLNMMYYNESEYVLRKIRGEFPKMSVTVISPTEEYYDTVIHGYHTELAEFIAMVDGKEKEFIIPSENVFVFVEKYTLEDYNLGRVRVSPELAKAEFAFSGSSQDYYYRRGIVESKAYFWAQDFMKRYPNEVNVYFENDIYIVYYIRQNPYYPFSMRTDYLSSLE